MLPFPSQTAGNSILRFAPALRRNIMLHKLLSVLLLLIATTAGAQSLQGDDLRTVGAASTPVWECHNHCPDEP
ncbi:hypothetical protein SAMN00790413_03949 [Deinococcus hopiensis KR-140]|uniref:Uncharacterized protein n=1 Tax=Deinococcus hopiensis KR-140 TaxID=695939 RepID=A0A1W1U9W3_9DEIO|nr:hypothetical protein SAMN00790413_03949 [Deinococcus hopiensis KR-140]